MNIGTEIKDATGEVRTVTRVYVDGSYDCPWCFMPVSYPNTICENPWCYASVWAKHEWVKADKEKRAAVQKERETRERNAQWGLKHAIERAQENDHFWSEARAKARQMGACLTCLRGPGWQNVRFIRHRKGCPK